MHIPTLSVAVHIPSVSSCIHPSSSMIRLALLVCACMHAHAAARTRAQLAGQDRRRRRRRPAACVPVNGHASIHLFRRPAGGGACGGSTGCRAKRHLNVFLFLSCENPIQRAGRAQSEGGSTVDYWLGSIEQGCNRPVWHGGGASAPAVAFRRACRFRFRPSCLLGINEAGGKASGSRDFGTCVYPELELDGNPGLCSGATASCCG